MQISGSAYTSVLPAGGSSQAHTGTGAHTQGHTQAQAEREEGCRVVGMADEVGMKLPGGKLRQDDDTAKPMRLLQLWQLGN
jgi:hypothetical protein